MAPVWNAGGTPGEIHTGDYHVVGADLRNPEVLQTKLITSGVMSRDVPTLVVAECVLQYLEPQARPTTPCVCVCVCVCARAYDPLSSQEGAP